VPAALGEIVLRAKSDANVLVAAPG